MRTLLAILAITAMPAAVVVFWTRSHSDLPQTTATFQPRSVVWADRVFTRPAELRRWLRARGERYEVWARSHPTQAARLEHRRPPRVAPAKAAKAAKPAKPSKASKTRTAAKRSEPRSDRAGWLVTAAEILAALLAITATAGLALRAGRRVRLPRVRPPTVNIDLRPLVDGLGNAAARLGQVRLPEVPNLRRTRPEPPPQIAEPARNGHRNGGQPLPAVEPATVVADVSSVAAPAVAVPAPLLEPLSVDDGAWELCTTACWRGYVSARFWAHPRGSDVSLAQSESFDWLPWQDAPRDPQAAEVVLAALCAQLQAQGWEPIGRGAAWYEVRFRRRPLEEW